jgi:hypothetical protein
MHKTHFWGITVGCDITASWDYGEDEVMLLNWYHPQPARRRDNFPSWAWIAWKGPVRHDPQWDNVGRQVDIKLIDSNRGVTRPRDYLDEKIWTCANALSTPTLLQLTGICPSFQLV